MPQEVDFPAFQKGVVVIRFKVLPSGKIMDKSMVLDSRSGHVGLDRAAWLAITGSKYPSLPDSFHGPYVELRSEFVYNMNQQFRRNFLPAPTSH